jgi:hypothetical protein
MLQFPAIARPRRAIMLPFPAIARPRRAIMLPRHAITRPRRAIPGLHRAIDPPPRPFDPTRLAVDPTRLVPTMTVTTRSRRIVVAGDATDVRVSLPLRQPPPGRQSPVIALHELPVEQSAALWQGNAHFENCVLQRASPHA